MILAGLTGGCTARLRSGSSALAQTESDALGAGSPNGWNGSLHRWRHILGLLLWDRGCRSSMDQLTWNHRTRNKVRSSCDEPRFFLLIFSRTERFERFGSRARGVLVLVIPVWCWGRSFGRWVNVCSGSQPRCRVPRSPLIRCTGRSQNRMGKSRGNQSRLNIV